MTVVRIVKRVMASGDLRAIKTVIDRYTRTKTGVLGELEKLFVSVITGAHFTGDPGIQAEHMNNLTAIMGKLDYKVVHSFAAEPVAAKGNVLNIEEMMYAAPKKRRGDTSINRIMSEISRSRRVRSAQSQIAQNTANEQLTQRIIYGSEYKDPSERASQKQAGLTKMVFKRILSEGAPPPRAPPNVAVETRAVGAVPINIQLLQPANGVSVSNPDVDETGGNRLGKRCKIKIPGMNNVAHRPAAVPVPRPAAVPVPRPAAVPVPVPRPAAVPVPRPAAVPVPRPAAVPVPMPNYGAVARPRFGAGFDPDSMGSGNRTGRRCKIKIPRK